MEFFEFQEVSAINWAHEFGAMYISLEHRFYGETSPVPGRAPSHHLHAMFEASSPLPAIANLQTFQPPTCASSPLVRCSHPPLPCAPFTPHITHALPNVSLLPQTRHLRMLPTFSSPTTPPLTALVLGLSLAAPTRALSPRGSAPSTLTWWSPALLPADLWRHSPTTPPSSASTLAPLLPTALTPLPQPCKRLHP